MALSDERGQAESLQISPPWWHKHGWHKRAPDQLTSDVADGPRLTKRQKGSQEMISLDNVGLQYGQKGPEVLHDISFFLPKGSFCWLLGPSGAGKSSLLRLMYLASLPTRGQLTVLGTQISAGNVGAAAREQLAALRRRIGVVFQDFRLLANLSTFDNVALPLRIAGREEAELRSDVTEILQWVGLWRKANIHPPQLSGGEQQRVAIARAVVAGPALLLADEPTGNLDDVQAERLMLLLQQMNRYGTTVVIATHNEALANRHKGRTLRLSDGRLIEDKVHGPMTAAGPLLKSIR